MTGPERRRGGRAYIWISERPAAVALTALALGVVATVIATQTFFVNRDQGRDINRIIRVQKTPCGRNTTNPSRKCEDQRQALARNEGIEGACIVHQRAEGTKGRNCPRFFVDRGRHGEAEHAETGGPENSPVSGSEKGATGLSPGVSQPDHTQADPDQPQDEGGPSAGAPNGMAPNGESTTSTGGGASQEGPPSLVEAAAGGVTETAKTANEVLGGASCALGLCPP